MSDNNLRKWVIKPVANLKEGKNDEYLVLNEQLENLRYELDDLYLEQEVLEDKIRDKEIEIESLSNQLDELEQEEDNNDSSGC